MSENVWEDMPTRWAVLPNKAAVNHSTPAVKSLMVALVSTYTTHDLDFPSMYDIKNVQSGKKKYVHGFQAQGRCPQV